MKNKEHINIYDSLITIAYFYVASVSLWLIVVWKNKANFWKGKSAQSLIWKEIMNNFVVLGGEKTKPNKANTI